MIEFKETYKIFKKESIKLYCESREFIIKELEKLPSKRVNFNKDETCICMCYNGGAHPECLANPFSKVYSVFLKDGEILVELEDDEEYDIDYATSTELYNLADAVLSAIENGYQGLDGEVFPLEYNED